MNAARLIARMASIMFAFLLPALDLQAAPVQWAVTDGGNGHYYELINAIVTWNQADSLAQGMSFLGTQGYLATVTSIGEVEFLRNNLPLPRDKIEFWLGGFQDISAADYSEPAGGWRWVTGEPWSFTYWYVDEPSNGAGPGSVPETYLQTAADQAHSCNGTTAQPLEASDT